MEGRKGYTAQPHYRSIVRLGPKRWGMTVRTPDGRIVVHELLGRPRLHPDACDEAEAN